LEYSLAKADFLNSPDLALVQALAIFLCLARRHDSPRFVWMMTGLAIRMGQYLGLQRDGAHFKHLSPFEIETRRKLWWALCSLDLRTAEDQGTELTIASGSFDTKIPLNINDADIDAETKEVPRERDGITDMSFARVMAKLCVIMRQVVPTASLEDKSRLLDDIYKTVEKDYLQYTNESGNVVYWVAVCIARLTKAKMTLIVFLPVQFSSEGQNLSEEIRVKLLVSAIEVAEYNHSLNAEPACRQWRWMYQTYTHWHAIVYLLLDIIRRPWSPIIERAWVALHSSWLIPAQTSRHKSLRIWVPLHKLMSKARKHRGAEIARLQADPQAAAALEMDSEFPVPSSSGPFAGGSTVDIFRERWRQLVSASGMPGSQAQAPVIPGAVADSFNYRYAIEPTLLDTSGQQLRHSVDESSIGHTESVQSHSSTVSSEQLGHTLGYAFDPLWGESETSNDAFSSLGVDPIDVSMELDGEIDWYTWIESAIGMERNV
jgi:hypothetical protein